MEFIYVSEPEEIDISSVQILVDLGYRVINGDYKVELNFSSEITTLLIRSKTIVDASLINRCPNLKKIVRVGVGLDGISLDICKIKSIEVYNAAGSNSNSVAEFVILMALMGSRNISKLEKQDLLDWDRFKFMGCELKTRSIGIIGFGNIGKLVYEKLKVLGCNRFYIYDPYFKQNANSDMIVCSNLNVIFENSNIITLHIPLTEQTYHSIGCVLLKKLKANSILINTARGGIVNEDELIYFLNKRKDCQYISDVFENEPKINSELLKLDNVVCTPHIASMTVEANKAMATLAVQNYMNDRAVVL